MTDPKHTEPVVTEAAREAAKDCAPFWAGLLNHYGEKTDAERWANYWSGKYDHFRHIQAFARFEAEVRTAAEAESRAREARLREALEKARKIIRDVEDYMARPNRGDWESECALCMGELFDDDREAIAAIDAALTASGGGEA